MAVLWTVSVSNCSYLWSVSYLAVNVWFVPLIPNSMTLLCLEWEKVCCKLVRTVPLHHHFRISFWSFTIYIDVFLSVCLLPICLSDMSPFKGAISDQLSSTHPKSVRLGVSIDLLLVLGGKQIVQLVNLIVHFSINKQIRKKL